MRLLFVLLSSPALSFLSHDFSRSNSGRGTSCRFVALESRRINEPPQDQPWKTSISSSISSPTKHHKLRPSKVQPKFRKISPRRRTSMTTSAALQMEQQILHALEVLSTAVSTTSTSPSTLPATAVLHSIPYIPTIRDCNSALAQLGDDGDMLRALRLFGKLRKLAGLQQRLGLVATVRPTLVTYSTLMSRFNRLSQPQVSLRLFRLLRADKILPDTRACNILMNTYVKLKQLDMAVALYQQMKDETSGTTSQKNVLLLDHDEEDQADDHRIITETLRPNLVTFNTLLDACSKVCDLPTALAVKQEMEASGIAPDERTYTSLIATTAATTNSAARAHYHDSTSKTTKAASLFAASRVHDATTNDYPQDPLSLAFALFEEMKDRKIAPNGMTYSALIDAAAKARRSDLALQGLRLMLRDKKELQSNSQANGNSKQTKTGVFSNEVGAWTAAINACGKAGRWETAVKLFYAMPGFGVDPNTVTCGCLMDTLLRFGRTAETLEVLRYMKAHGIVPSEVMYTSLMTRAERLAQMEHRKAASSTSRHWQEDGDKGNEEDTAAISVYTELMKSLVETTGKSSGLGTTGSNHITVDSNTLLLKVFLVFQEMKSSGVEPDLASFNALLRACARVGDVERAEQVLEQIQESSLVPDDTTWRQLLCAAGKAGRSDLTMSIWRRGIALETKRRVADERPIRWTPSVESYLMLLSAHLYEASTTQDQQDRLRLLRMIVVLYESLLLGDESLGLDRIDIDQVLNSQRAMLLILQSFVQLAQLSKDPGERRDLRKMTNSIIQLDCLCHDALPIRIRWDAAEALKTAQVWSDETAVQP